MERRFALYTFVKIELLQFTHINSIVNCNNFFSWEGLGFRKGSGATKTGIFIKSLKER